MFQCYANNSKLSNFGSFGARDVKFSGYAGHTTLNKSATKAHHYALYF